MTGTSGTSPVCLVHLASLVYSVIVWFNQIHETDRTDLSASPFSRFTGIENAAWKKARPWAKRLSWQPQGGRVK
jgi:hypothetical protein